MRKWFIFTLTMIFYCCGSETNFTSSISNFSPTQKYTTSQAYENNGSVNSNTGELSLEDLCKLYGVLAENCSCKNPDIKAICDFVNLKTVKSFSCDSTTNKVIGISNLISSTLAIIGNGFVIGFGFNNRKNLSRFRYLIIGLSISDFFFAVFQLIISIPETWTCHWLYGLFLCKVVRALLAASANIAVGFIVVIAVDRYIGVMYVFNSILNQERLLAAVLLNVLAGILSIIPPLLVLQLGEFTTCSEEWAKKNSTIYTWILFFMYYLIPVVALISLYFVMIASLRKDNLSSNVLNDEQRLSRVRKNKKILLMLVLILVTFATLVLPNRIVWIINDLYGLSNIKDKKLLRFYRMVSEIPYGFHAAANPIIYSLIDKKFQQQLKHLFSFALINPKLSSPKLRSVSEVTIQMNISTPKM